MKIEKCVLFTASFAERTKDVVVIRCKGNSVSSSLGNHEGSEHSSYRAHLLAVGYEEKPLVHCDVVVHIPGHCADGTQCGHIQSYPQIYVHVIG